jgi:putative hemolysin
MSTIVWVLVAMLATSFLCSVLEAVFLSVQRSYVAVLKSQGEWAGTWLERAQRNVEEPIAAILTLNTIAHTVGATMGGAFALELFGSAWVAAFSAGLTLVILVFTEIVPKTLGATYWNRLAKPSAYVLAGMVWIMRPLLAPLRALARAISPKAARPTVSRAELEVLAEIGRREGALDEDEWKVVSKVMRLEEVTLGEVMTPRIDIVAVPRSASIEEVQETMLRTGHLRLPVYEGSLDRIAGVVLGRDVWKAHRDGVQSLEQVLRPVPFAPASKAVEDLIPEMRTQRMKMAIVVDEFGGTAGLVTLEDLIEEIIGEIQDEHEADEPVDFQRLHGGRLRVWGGTTLREAAEVLEFAPSEEEMERYDSLGGYVFGRLNRVPVLGDEVDVGSGTLRVTQMRGRRIEYMLFIPRDAEN